MEVNYGFTTRIISRMQECSLNEPANTLFEGFRLEIMRTRFRNQEAALLDKSTTPKVEAFVYALGSAKEIALGIINLLYTGLWLAQQKEIFSDEQEFFHTVVSFYEEGDKIYSAMYAAFPPVEEALTYYKNYCEEILGDFGLKFDSFLEKN